MYSDSSEKSSANCRTKSVLKITCYADQDQKGTQAAAVDLDPKDPLGSTAPWDLKDQSG